jgi:predicted nucleotidyltransferase
MGKQEVVETIRGVLTRHPYVVRAELFGYLARGEERPDSDVDLLVVYDQNRPRGFRAYSILGEMERALGRRVDMVQEKLLHDFIRKRIQNERELIYERR